MAAFRVRAEFVHCAKEMDMNAFEDAAWWSPDFTVNILSVIHTANNCTCIFGTENFQL